MKLINLKLNEYLDILLRCACTGRRFRKRIGRGAGGGAYEHGRKPYHRQGKICAVG